LTAELRKTKEERDKYSAESEDARRKISTLRQASESTGNQANAAASEVKALESKINDLEARSKSFQMKASQAEERADRAEAQLKDAKAKVKLFFLFIMVDFQSNLSLLG
jgi:chromosome segregation ATPase